jgi:hypothetical protein
VKQATGARDTAIAVVLTADQKAKLKALLGEPFAGSIRAESAYALSDRQGFRPTREANFGRYRIEPLMLAENKAVQAELKLTPDQIDRAKAVAKELTEKFAPSANPFGPAFPAAAPPSEEQSKFIEKALPGLLTPDQAKRFRQIMLQQRERSDVAADVPSAVGYPGVAEAVKLADDQKKRLLAGGDPADVLTPEQQVAIIGMLGDPFTGDLSARSVVRPRAGDPASARAPTIAPRTQLLLYLPWDAVAVTPVQAKDLVAAITKFQLATARGNNALNRPAGPDAAAQELDQSVTAILTPAQLTRLDQLVLLSAAARDLRAAMTGPDAGRKLNLTPDQLLKVIAAEQEARRIAARLDRVELPPEKRAEVRRLIRERLDDRILAALTPEQRAAWKELAGDPYPGFRKTIPAARSGV